MSNTPFEFELYRLNITSKDLMFEFMGKPMSSDDDIVSAIKKATAPAYDIIRESRSAIYKWSLREYTIYDNKGVSEKSIVGITLARSLVEQNGSIVTDDGIVSGTSEAEPPLAIPIHLFSTWSAISLLSSITA